MINSIKKYLKKAKEYSSNNAVDEAIDLKRGKKPALWTGVDLDGTLAYHDRNSQMDKVGDPVIPMLDLVKELIRNNIRVKIFTARAQYPEQLPIIREWLKANGLPELEITNIKDFNMQWLLDDRCIQVERNTGRLIFKD
ncbi:hypothetical protein [Desulfobacula sp.]